MKSVDAILKEKTYADKIIETLTKVSGKSISPDSKYWIHVNTRDMNIKVKRSECVLENLKWFEEYPNRCMLIVQNGKVYNSLSRINESKEALVLIPENTGEEEKNYIYLYTPQK